MTVTTRSVSTSAGWTRRATPLVLAEVDEVVGLRVVHDDAAPEAPAKLRREEQADLARRRAPHEAACDEDRHRADAEPLELVGDRRDRLVPRPDLDAGIGSDGCSITIVAEPHPRSRSASGGPASGKASASRTAAPTSSIASRGRRRPQHDVVRSHLRDDDPRVGEQRDPGHGTAR